jgi:choline kinase
MQAIILAAGMGTRLRSVSPSKPVTQLCGRPLLHHVLDNLRSAGVTRPAVITGYNAGVVTETALRWGDVEILHNPDWQAPNGVSVLAAASWLDTSALLVMGDHLASPSLYRGVAGASLSDAGLVLGVDRRLGHPWVDEEDVTRVSTLQGRIHAIGKQLASYDCHDCGVFHINAELMAALASLTAPGLSDGVRLLANKGRARVLDISAYDWIDIDDPRALKLAEAWLASAAF